MLQVLKICALLLVCGAVTGTLTAIIGDMVGAELVGTFTARTIYSGVQATGFFFTGFAIAKVAGKV